MNRVLKLPDELIESILVELRAQDLLSFAAACHRIKAIADKSQHVQLILELATYGYVLAPNWRRQVSTQGSVQDLGRSFRRIYRRWETFDYTARRRIICARVNQRVINGILGIGSPTPENKISFYKLFDKSCFQREEQHMENKDNDIDTIQPWIEHKLEGYCPLFYWDVRQDLLVCYIKSSDSYHHITIRTLSSNLPHPSAKVHSFGSNKLPPLFGAAIVGERLIMHYRGTESEEAFIIVRNWKTWEEMIEPIPDARQGNFILLTDDLLLLLREGHDKTPSAHLEVHDISGTTEDLAKPPSEVQPESESHIRNPGIGMSKPTLRLKLLLPFQKYARDLDLLGEPQHIFREELSGAPGLPNDSAEFHEDSDTAEESANTFYVGDRSAERISVLWLQITRAKYYVVVSHHHILRLVPSETVSLDDRQEDIENPTMMTSQWGSEVVKAATMNHTHPVTIQWVDWGPVSTRWFHSWGTTNFNSSYGAWVYFCGNMEEFINVHNLYPRSLSSAADDMPTFSLPEISRGAVVFCDFNQRLIKRGGSTYQPHPMPERSSSTMHRSSDQSEDSPSSSSHSSPSNIIAENIITEEWVLESPDFTEVVRSCLPFRVFIRKNLEQWIQCPTMGGNPFAVLIGLGEFDVFYFGDKSRDGN